MNIPKLKQTFRADYKIFQNGHTVVCYVTPLRDIYFLFGNFTSYEKVYKETISTNYLESKRPIFKGVATLKVGDAFDIDYAKEIAKKKAMRAYFRWIKTEYGSTWKEILNFVESRLQFLKQADERVNQLTNEIKEMTKED